MEKREGGREGGWRRRKGGERERERERKKLTYSYNKRKIAFNTGTNSHLFKTLK
jgi:hypothetical protein